MNQLLLSYKLHIWPLAHTHMKTCMHGVCMFSLCFGDFLWLVQICVLWPFQMGCNVCVHLCVCPVMGRPALGLDSRLSATLRQISSRENGWMGWVIHTFCTSLKPKPKGMWNWPWKGVNYYNHAVSKGVKWIVRPTSANVTLWPYASFIVTYTGVFWLN